jgi:hypothetical protein
MPHHLASGSLDGRDPAQAGEGSLATQPLGVVFKATIKSVAAWSVPMAAKETNSGATCATNWSSFVRLARRSLSSHLQGTFGSPRRRVRPVQDVAHSHSPVY